MKRDLVLFWIFTALGVLVAVAGFTGLNGVHGGYMGLSLLLLLVAIVMLGYNLYRSMLDLNGMSALRAFHSFAAAVCALAFLLSVTLAFWLKPEALAIALAVLPCVCFAAEGTLYLLTLKKPPKSPKVFWAVSIAVAVTALAVAILFFCSLMTYQTGH